MLQKSVELYDHLEQETGMATDWKKVGSLRLAASKDRMLEIKSLATMARSFGLEMNVISAGEAKALFPLIETKGLEGAAFIPSDGHVDPASLCQAIAAGARLHGATIKQGVEVLGFEARGNRLSVVITDAGTYEVENVVLAAGMWSRELSAKLGVSIPACAVEHQYVVTEPIPDFPADLPSLRDPDRLVYYKPEAGGRLLIGGYEAATVPFGKDGVPNGFVRQLLPENMERFAPLAENAAKVIPVVNEVGIRQMINGPIPYSADGDFVMGVPPGRDNLYVATGFLYGIAAAGGAGEMMAEWILHGRPSLDLWPLDIRRFGPHHGTPDFMYPRAVEHYAHHYKLRYPNHESGVAREIRRSPLYEVLQRRGAVYGSKNGWERPLWFAPEGVEPVDQLDFLEPGWKQYVAQEHHAIRDKVALIDQTSFSKFELVGPQAFNVIQRLAVSNMDKPVGSVIYTQLCNERGGIEADLTATRLGENHFYIVTGSGFGVHDSDWISRHLPDDESAVLLDVTSAHAVINICGPQARKVLQTVCTDDISSTAFPFATARELMVGPAPVRAIRIGYVGELGWELHIPTEYTLHVYDLLWQAGQKYKVVNAGYRAIDSLRMEKGYLYWSADITPDYSPIEAGLGSRIHFNSKTDFIGREALAKQKSSKPQRKLCFFVSEEDLPVFGGETILLDGKVVSLATSAAFSYTVNKTILYGYLSSALTGEAEFELEAFGERYPICKVEGPQYDPEGSRLRT